MASPCGRFLAIRTLAPTISPVLLFDYAGPMEFPPTEQRRGVGGHPHRGFETVTIVYSGEVEHRDSSGGGGRDRSRRRTVDDCSIRSGSRRISWAGFRATWRRA